FCLLSWWFCPLVQHHHRGWSGQSTQQRFSSTRAINSASRILSTETRSAAGVRCCQLGKLSTTCTTIQICARPRSYKAHRDLGGKSIASFRFAGSTREQRLRCTQKI